MDRTIRLKLNTNLEQGKILQRVLSDYTRAFNQMCEYGFTNGEKNRGKLHNANYYDLKAKLPGLPSQLICSACNKATEALKSVSALTKLYPAKLKAFEAKKATILAKGKPFERRSPRKPSCPQAKKFFSVRYDQRSYWVKWDSKETSLATHSGRLVLTFDIPNYAQKYLVTTPHVASADLIFSKGQYWLHVVVTLPNLEYLNNNQVVGVDLGLIRPAVTSNRKFLGKRRWAEVDRKYFRIRRKLQSKGTRSAKRHLKRLSGRQQRFHRDCDHILSRRIVQSVTTGTTIVIEDLKEIRNTGKMRKGETKRRLHSWSFSQFQSFLYYKAKELGQRVVTIDPRYTSQTCSRCDYQDKKNRRTQSIFLCNECGYELNADLNASYNIRNKHLARVGISDPGAPQSIGVSCQSAASSGVAD